MKYELTEKNKKALYRRVQEYAERSNWPSIARIIGGNPKEDLLDYVYGEEACAERGAPNFV